MGMLLAYHYGWTSPFSSEKHNRLTDLAIRNGLLHPEALHLTEEKCDDRLSFALLTATGQRCVTAYKRGRWNKTLDELSARGGSFTLKLMSEELDARTARNA